MNSEISDCHDSNDCAEFVAALADFLCGEVPTEQDRWMHEQSQSCVHCAQLAEAEKRLRLALRSACFAQTPPSLRERVRATLVQLSARSDGTTTTIHYEERRVAERSSVWDNS